MNYSFDHLTGAFHDIIWTIINFVKNYDYATLFLNALLVYSKCCENTKQFCKSVYANSTVVQMIVNKCIYWYHAASAAVFGYRIEPETQPWISTCVLLKDKIRYVTQVDSYLEHYELQENNETLGQTYVNLNETLCSLIQADESILEGMVIMKYFDEYFFNSYNRTTASTDETIALEFPRSPCEFRFPCVEYTHVAMKKGIYLDVSKQHYLENNTLFSELFLKRYFRYCTSLPSDFVFDEQYELRIIDNNMKPIILHKGDYITLTKDSYKIDSATK